MAKTIIVSICDDNYAPLLLSMLESLGDKLKEFDLGIVELALSDTQGLSSDYKQKILALKPDCKFAYSRWFLDVPKRARTVLHKAFQTKPFLPNLFSGYDSYIYVDADIWFFDVSALDDYISAGSQHGIAVASEANHFTTPYTHHIKQHRLFNFKFGRTMRTRHFGSLKKFYGADIAFDLGRSSSINSGVVYMSADSRGWDVWKEAMMDINYSRTRKTRMCDQTCLQYGIWANEVPVTIMSACYNWSMGCGSIPIIDRANRQMLDPVYPHNPIKVFHLTRGERERKTTLLTTDGDSVDMLVNYATVADFFAN